MSAEARAPFTERRFVVPLVLVTSLFFLWALGVNLNLELGGIALGTIVIIAGYHLARWVEPRALEGTMMAVGQPGVHREEPTEPTEPNRGT